MALRDVNAVVTITTNAVKAIDDGKKLKQIYADINEQLNLMKSEGKVDTKEFKDMQKLAEDTKAKINEMLRGMELIDKVMGDISGHIGKDLNRALRETSKEFNKTSSSTDEGKAKLEKLRDVVADLKRELSDRRGLTMSLKDAEAQLKNLNNASLDKLRQGLAAVREEAAKTADPARRAQYQQYARNYEAQIAIKEHGNIGSAPATGTLKSEDRLRAEAERQRLVTAYQAASRSDDAAHKTWAAEALKQIQQYNSALQALTETERKDLQLKREESARNEMLAKENEIIDRIKKGQKVTLEELIELQKHYKSELEKSQGLNITDPDDIKEMERLNQNLRIFEEQIRKIRAESGGEVMKNVRYAASNLGSVSIDQLSDYSKKGKELFSIMKPGDPGYDQLKADLIAIDAELERVTPKWNELAQAEQALAKATDVANRAFIDDKVMLEELTEAQKTLEAQIKKMSGLSLTPTEQGELNKTKGMLEEINKALDEIALKDIDFNNLDATPTEKLEAALKNLEQQEKRLAGTQKDEAEEVAKKKRAIREQIQRNKQATIDYANAEKVAANRGKHSVEELQVAYKALEQKLLGLRTNEYKEIAKTKQQMQQLKTKIDDVTGAVKKQSSTWDSAVRNITAYVGVFGAFNFIKNKIMDVFKANTKLSDSLADIRKVSGLSSEAINELYNNISKIDSRNTIETLNELAYTGAKLGIGQNYGVEGLTGFVKAAEQVQMALGEDMGEKSLPELSKMVEVMGLIPKYGVEQSMQKAASAIFQLGATSTATGTNIVEFSKRLYGLANVSRISTQDLLALGSASDAMGLMPEVSATAFNKLFTSIQRQHNLIEQSLGMAKGTIKQYYDEGKTMDAIVEIFERMNEKGNLNLLGSIFKDLGSDGARLVNVMATMADRADILRKHLQTSRDAFKEGEAVIGEYMIQNQTAAALIERSANLWAKAFVNPEGVDMVKELAQAWYDLSKAMTQSEGLMASLHGSLQLIGLAIESLIKMFPFLLRQAVVLGLAFGFKSAVLGVISLVKSFGSLITAIRSVNSAMGSLNLVMKSNPLLMVAATITTAITLLYDYSKAAEEAAEREAARQAELKKSFDNSREAVEKVVKPLETYKKVLDEANLSEKQKMEMVKQFRRDYQEYLDYLGIEINSALDLANAYAKVVDIMKIKKAYEERENYRTQLNGETRMERIGAQSKVEGAARAFGLSDVDKAYLEKNQTKGTDALYRELIERKMGAKALSQDEDEITFIYVDDKLVNAGAQFGPRAKKRYKKSGSKELYNAIDEYIASFRKEKATDKEVDAMFDSEFTWTDKNGKKRKLSEFNMDEYNQKVQEARWKRGGSLDNEKPDKDAIAAARKAAQDHKQAIRKDLQDAKQESDAIIAKIEEWYRLQETVVTGFAADGKWTQQQAEMVNRELEAAKNEALANARLAISGRDTQTWEQTKESLRVMMFDTGQWSQELFQQMMDVSMASIRQNLSRIDKEGGQYGITTSSLKDGLDKNAAGNRRKVQELRNKTAKEVEKMMLKYDFLEQAVKAFDDRLTSLGLLTESAEAAARRIQAGGQSEEQVQQQRSQGLRGAASKFIREGSKNLTVNYESGEDLAKWIGDFSRDESWADAFKEDFDKWRSDSKKYKGEMQAFFLSLVQMSDDYTEATKKAYEREKKLQDQRFQLAGYKTAEERTDTSLELQGKMQSAMGSGQNFWQQNGMADTMKNDPEILRIQNHIYYRNLEYEDAKAHLDRMLALQQEELKAAKDSGASEQQLAEMQEQQRQARAGIEELTYQRQTELLTATADLAAKVSQEIASRVSTIQELSQPIADFAENAGQKLGDMMFNMQSQSMTWNQIWKNMVLALAQSTVKMGAQWLTQKIQQALFYKQMEADEALHQSIMTMIAIGGATARMEGEAAINTTGLATNAAINSAEVGQEVSMATILTMLGISKGAAKIIGTLGWWGIPLIAVISSLLLGLLASALSTAGQESGGASAAAKPKIKLASGMLTYDEGNVRTVVGDDGRVYRAKEQRSLPEGVSMVTEPIATRVNGQQALVGERGPEIVIGRRTTRAIQMNRPDLLRDLALIDRGITTRKVRTFDEGNISDMATAFAGQLPATQPSADGQQGGDAQRERDQAMLATLGVLSQTIGQLQQQLAAGIHAEMNMFGDNGAYKKFQQADKFYKKYGG